MNESGPGFQNKVQQVTVGNTISFDTGLSNAVTIEKCTFLKSAFLFLVFDSPIEYQLQTDRHCLSVLQFIVN